LQSLQSRFQSTACLRSVDKTRTDWDEDGVYDPADFNDGLLLGLKGTMSAADPSNRLVAASLEKRWNDALSRVKEVRRLARDHTDAQMVDLLNGRGERTAKGNPFTVASVRWIRHKHRIPAPQLKLSHELTVAEVAAKFHVSRGVVYYWINRDILPARRIGEGHPYWITLCLQTSGRPRPVSRY
jgi:hypothetical protein